jgi:hypothetical protein
LRSCSARWIARHHNRKATTSSSASSYISDNESTVPSFPPPSAPRISVGQRIWIPADHRILSEAIQLIRIIDYVLNPTAGSGGGRVKRAKFRQINEQCSWTTRQADAAWHSQSRGWPAGRVAYRPNSKLLLPEPPFLSTTESQVRIVLYKIRASYITSSTRHGH